MKFNQDDQILVDNFVRELLQRISERFKNNIDFIILYGSAARGEFVRGESDIDLLIQTKNASTIDAVKRYADEIFWALNDKFQMGFEKVCARAPNGLIEKIFKKAESQTPLFIPVFVFGPDDLDWINGRILKKELALGANFLASQGSIFLNFKREGKVYYGRDIRKEINVKLAKWEKIKGILIPQYFTLAALILWPFLWRKSLKYSVKAVLYDIDASLIYLNKISRYSLEEKIELFKNEVHHQEAVDFLEKYLKLKLYQEYAKFNRKIFSVIKEALNYKISGFNSGKFQAFVFIIKTLRFVFWVNITVVFRGYFRGRCTKII